MRHLLGTSLACALIVTGFFWQRDSIAEERDTDDKNVRVTTVYKISDLPVWTLDLKFDPTVVMQLIQATVSPRDWEAKGGESTMAPYPQGTAIIISTDKRNHDKIKDLLEGMRH